MKKYKLTGTGHNSLNIGEIYSEDHVIYNNVTVGRSVRNFPEDWELVEQLTELPKCFTIKSDASNLLRGKYIDWLNSQLDSSFTGQRNDFFYGVDKLGNSNLDHDLSYFGPDVVELTLEQWDEIVNGFTLPEKWQIKVKDMDEYSYILDWAIENNYIESYHKNYSPSSFPYFIGVHGKYGVYDCKLLKCKEITLDQFKRHVLKENIMNKLPKNYIVRCDNNRDHCNAAYSNYYDDGFVIGSEWKYIICSDQISNAQYKREGIDNSGNCISDNIQDKYLDLQVFSYEEWKQLKENKMKKIIGYKFKEGFKEQYNKALNTILGRSGNSTLYKSEYLIYGWKDSIETLEKVGVLDLWFDAVYEDEYKVGDWVIVRDYIPGLHNTPLKIEKIYIGFQDNKYCNFNKGDTRNFEYGKITRKATTQEIKAAQIKLPKIGNWNGEYLESRSMIKYGCKKFHIETIRELIKLDVVKIVIEGESVLKSHLVEMIKYVDNQ